MSWLLLGGSVVYECTAPACLFGVPSCKYMGTDLVSYGTAYALDLDRLSCASRRTSTRLELYAYASVIMMMITTV